MGADRTTDESNGLAYASSRGRWVLLATVLGSAMAFIDETVVNVALPRLGESLGATLSGLTWTVNAYGLTLAAFMLLGGALGDRFGRRRVYVLGAAWFAGASLACGLSPNLTSLVVARAVQGIGAALLTPGSLAILQASFRPEDRGRAIGAWSGLSALSASAGPLLGGWVVQRASWRWVFLINIPIALVVIGLADRELPESKDPSASGPLDVRGAALGALGLGGLTDGLVTWQDQGTSAGVVGSLALGLASLAAFAHFERRARSPMFPMSIFDAPLFRWVNLITFVVYAGLGGVMFWLVLALQVIARFSPLEAGLAVLPLTLCLLILSPSVGAWGERSGPRLPMTLGPLIASGATVLLGGIGPQASYLVNVAAPMVLFGLGLSFIVAPLTVTVLAAAPAQHAGAASGINNSVSSVAGLLTVAVLPLVAGLKGTAYQNPSLLAPAFHRATLTCAALLAVGGVLSAIFVRTPPRVAGPREGRTVP